MTKRTSLGIAGLAAGLFLAACGGGGDDPDAGGGDDTPPPIDANRIDAPPSAYQLSDVLDLTTGTLIGDMAPETQTTAVLPDSDYLVWAGAYDQNAAGNPPALPKMYQFALCASQYTPPPGETCDYTETNDAANDTTPAASGQTVGATPFVVCGNINAKAPDANMRIDADLYRFRVAAEARVEFRIYSAEAQPMTANFVAVYNDAGTALAGFGTFLGTHGIFSAVLPAGRYRLSAESYGAAQPPANAAYHMIVSTSDLETRCGAPTGNPTFTERADGASNNGNDVVEVRFGSDPYHALTAGMDDVERSNITAEPGMSYSLAGTIADTDPADEYKDRDTYLVHTGANTNQMDLRLQWPDADADLDYFFFIPVP